MSAAANGKISLVEKPTAKDQRMAVPRTSRIESIDVIRGVVMVLMAIDHVRVYSGQPAGGPTAGIFLTRWITHFVAPAFIFLAGTSAFLHGRKLASRSALSRFLLTRGLWLVFLELTVLRVAWTFNFDFAHYLLAGVIWVIGWCMVLMAGLIYLPVRVLGVLGLAIIFGHNITDFYSQSLYTALGTSHWAWLWQVLYFGGPIKIGANGPDLFVLYSIVPWIGVMAAGYSFGQVMTLEPARRRKICLALGTAAILLFLILRGFNLYGDPRPWSAPKPPAATQTQTGAPQSAQAAPSTAPKRPQTPAWISFLSTTKYPASLLFLLMTLGPALLALPLLENASGPVAAVFKTFGRVPFFYYALHIPLIHFAAIIVSLLRSGSVDHWLFLNHPVMIPPAPPQYLWSLGLLYLVWAIVVAVLYFPCRWFADYKQQHKDVGFLSYL